MCHLRPQHVSRSHHVHRRGDKCGNSTRQPACHRALERAHLILRRVAAGYEPLERLEERKLDHGEGEIEKESWGEPLVQAGHTAGLPGGSEGGGDVGVAVDLVGWGGGGAAVGREDGGAAVAGAQVRVREVEVGRAGARDGGVAVEMRG